MHMFRGAMIQLVGRSLFVPWGVVDVASILFESA